jgi:hypothetical protein
MKKSILAAALLFTLLLSACAAPIPGSTPDLMVNAQEDEMAQDIPGLAITTPRDLFRPCMSSMFGFELVLNAPGDPASYTYVCDGGAFCTYKDGKVTHQGNNLTSAEKVYWAPVEGGEYVYSGEMDKILISVTALDQEGKAIARGTAAIEHDPEGGWFKFTGEAVASQSTDETPA